MSSQDDDLSEDKDENTYPEHRGNVFFKRLFDIVVSALGLLLLSPFFLFVILLIKKYDSGPIFYRGSRVGYRGKEFGILKFRTMFDRPESFLGARITAQDDARITPIGQWLRSTKLNELPQLWNVLVGDMSLVGPRPEDPVIASHWPADARREILSVRPGITSPASVAYYDEERLLNSSDVVSKYLNSIQPDKLRLDRLYVRHHSFLTDLDAIFWTLFVLIPRIGKNKLYEGWLFGGPFTRFVRNYVSWFVIDFILALSCITSLGLMWRAYHPLDVGLGRSALLAVLISFLFGLFNTVLGVKTVNWSRAAPEDAFSLFASAVLVMVINFGLYYFLPITWLPFNFVIQASLLILFACIAVRYRLRLISGLVNLWVIVRNQGYGAGERAIIIGAGEGGSFITWLLRQGDFKKLYSVIGIVDDDPVKQGRRYDGLIVLGTTADIPRLVEKHDIGTIIYSITKISAEDHERIHAVCRATGRKVIVISNLIKLLQSYFAGDADYCKLECPFAKVNNPASVELSVDEPGL